MDREKLLCYLEAAVSLQYAMDILDQEQDFLLDQFEHKTPLRLHNAREHALNLSFLRPLYQDILVEHYRLSCLLDDLYSYDMISEKLHDSLLLPCYELFATGKCEHLEGPDSAYERILERPDPTPAKEYLRMDESVVSLLNEAIRRRALPVNPIRSRNALLKDIIGGISAIVRQLDNHESPDPVDTSPYAPALQGVNDRIRLARACYSRWLSEYPDES